MRARRDAAERQVARWWDPPDQANCSRLPRQSIPSSRYGFFKRVLRAFRQRFERFAAAQQPPSFRADLIGPEARASASAERGDIVRRDEGVEPSRAACGSSLGNLRHRRGHDREAAIFLEGVGPFQEHLVLFQSRAQAGKFTINQFVLRRVDQAIAYSRCRCFRWSRRDRSSVRTPALATESAAR